MSVEDAAQIFLSTPSARRATACPASTSGFPVYFYPRPPRGGRQTTFELAMNRAKFLSTPSARRATRAPVEYGCALGDFYPRPPRGGRQSPRSLPILRQRFLSTPSARRATFCLSSLYQIFPISIHALREEGDSDSTRKRPGKAIFLSTPSARRATCPPVGFFFLCAISIHALREEGDRGLLFQHRPCNDFYPRPPRGGRLNSGLRFRDLRTNFYPRPPRGGRLVQDVTVGTTDDISIHALREEGDSTSLPSTTPASSFLSTPSARRATQKMHRLAWIHNNFYPRPPRGGRLLLLLPCCLQTRHFYPRPPRGGRRWAIYCRSLGLSISIHALREEGDCCSLRSASEGADFYPRPPRGGRQQQCTSDSIGQGQFLSTPSARRATLYWRRPIW